MLWPKMDSVIGSAVTEKELFHLLAVIWWLLEPAKHLLHPSLIPSSFWEVADSLHCSPVWVFLQEEGESKRLVQRRVVG